jgi:hypothetical protein
LLPRILRERRLRIEEQERRKREVMQAAFEAGLSLGFEDGVRTGERQAAERLLGSLVGHLALVFEQGKRLGVELERDRRSGLEGLARMLLDPADPEGKDCSA